jgi:hypothetical protein
MSLHRVKALEQVDRAINRVGAWRLEPLEGTRIAAPGKDIENRTREINAVNIRLAVRPQPIEGVPEPPDAARRGPPGASRTLIGGVLCDALRDETVNRACRVIPGYLLKPRIDDASDPRDRYRRFGNVGGNNDAANAAVSRCERTILPSAVKRAVQREHFDISGDAATNFGDGLLNLERTWKKTQHVARRDLE